MCPAMHSAAPDLSSVVEDNPNEVLAIRRDRDAAAYRDARVSAAASMRDLLALLVAGAPLADVQPQARATMSKVGSLWEAAAHLSEHQ